MNSKNIRRLTSRKLGKLTISYEGLTKAAKALKKMYPKSINSDHLIETAIVTYYLKSGRKVRTISRDLIA